MSLDGKLKKIRMGTSLKKQQRQFGVILQPSHQPVGLNMALPCLNLLVHQLMRTINRWQFTIDSKNFNGILYQLYIQATLFTTFQVLLESLRIANAIHESTKYFLKHVVHAIGLIYPAIFHVLHSLTESCRLSYIFIFRLGIFLYLYRCHAHQHFACLFNFRHEGFVGYL